MCWKLSVKENIIICCVLALFCLFITWLFKFNNEHPPKNNALTYNVETIISNDMKTMDSISKNNVFWESRVVLKRQFNISDEFEPAEVTNVFQTNVETSETEVVTTVYMFIHNLTDNTYKIEIHKDAFITDDIELDMKEIKIDFSKAFKLARESNYPPSTTKYMTLRHGFGRNLCNTFYTIGNSETGHLWVDAITGKVVDKDPTGLNN